MMLSIMPKIEKIGKHRILEINIIKNKIEKTLELPKKRQDS